MIAHVRRDILVSSTVKVIQTRVSYLCVAFQVSTELCKTLRNDPQICPENNRSPWKYLFGLHFLTLTITWSRIIFNLRKRPTSPLVFPQNKICATSAEVPYWWRVTTQIPARGKFASTNQKLYPDLGSDSSSVWWFLRSFPRSQLARSSGESNGASRNVACFLRLQ